MQCDIDESLGMFVKKAYRTMTFQAFVWIMDEALTGLNHTYTNLHINLYSK